MTRIWLCVRRSVSWITCVFALWPSFAVGQYLITTPRPAFEPEPLDLAVPQFASPALREAIHHAARAHFEQSAAFAPPPPRFRVEGDPSFEPTTVPLAAYGQGLVGGEEATKFPDINRPGQTYQAPPSTAASDAKEAPPEQLKQLIAVHLWVLTIDMPRAKASEDITASIVSRANELPTVVGSRDDVRVLIGKLTLAGVLKKCREYRTQIIDGQFGTMQSGGNQPQINASQVAARGRVNAIQFTPVSTNITLSPRIYQADKLEVQINWNSSELVESTTVAVVEAEEGNRVPATFVHNQQFNVVGRLQNDSAVLVQSDMTAEPANENSSVRTQLYILSAYILPPPK